MYALVIVKNGPQGERCSAGSERVPAIRANHPDLAMALGGNRARLSARQQTMASLAKFLRGRVDRLIVDETGLTGKYDFHLESGFLDNADDGEPRILP